MKTLTAVLAGVLLIATPSGVDSCGIAAPGPVFATRQRPADLKAFLDGKVGALQRSYGQRYLIGAFRILSGLPLTAAEAKTLYQFPDSGNYDPGAFSGLDAWT